MSIESRNVVLRCPTCGNDQFSCVDSDIIDLSEALDETNDKCGLFVETKGTWLNTSMYEVPTLAIINEVYFKMQYNYDKLLKDFEKKLKKMFK